MAEQVRETLARTGLAAERLELEITASPLMSDAEEAAERSVSVLLTGMGEDGVAGMLKARERGSLTVVQDEHSSAVWGMPGRAWKMGGGDAKLELRQIGPTLTTLLGRAA